MTLTVLSYVFFRDWAPFRLVMQVFIGVAAGYAGAVVMRDVLWGMLLQPLIVEHNLLLLVPLLLALLLLTKISTGSVGKWGNLSIAYLVGVGAAVAIGGAVIGTIIPQSLATMDALNFSLMRAQGIGFTEFVTTGVFILVGTVASLAYFHFHARQRPSQPPARRKGIEGLARVGEWFIATTFGTLFAGVYLAAASALAYSITSLWQFLSMWLPH